MRAFWVVLLCACLLAVSTKVARAENIPEATGNKIVPCPMGTPLGEIEGETIICGQIQVPENWAQPDGSRLTISYARLVSKATVPFDDPVIYFEGGPGGTSLGSLLSYLPIYTRLREDRDIILWDQRGTRYSSQLYCPDDARIADMAAYVEAMPAFIAEVSALPDPSLESGPQPVLDRERAVAAFDRIANCRQYFAEQGIDLTQYKTANTVLDALALMKALDDPAYNFHAVSYGTTVALSLMQYYADHPDADLPPIRSVVLDGVYPLNYDFSEEEFIAPYNILRVFADCEADAACAAAYPNIRQRLLDLLAKLDAEPLQLADGSQLDSATLSDFLRGPIVLLHSAIPYLPRLVDELERGETATYDLILDAMLQQKSLNPPAEPEELVSELGAGVPELTTIAASLRETAMQVEMVGLEAILVREALASTETPPDLYLDILDRYLKLFGISSAMNLTPVLERFVGSPEEQTREALLTLNTNVGLKVVKRQMDALVEGMTDAEVAQVFAGLTSREFFGELTGFNAVFNSIVNCNDRAASINTESAFAQYNTYEAPQLLLGFDAVAGMQVKCEAMGLAAAGYAPPPPGVVSDIPALVMNGALDMATPVESGDLVMQTLTNSRMLTFPRLTHGVTMQSLCAIDLAYNFIMYPERKLNSACVERLRRPFVMPNDQLPELSDPS